MDFQQNSSSPTKKTGITMFKPRCLPILIGSLPIFDHEEAVRLILKHTPQIPLWPQLPKLVGEGMVRQFITGFPGLQEEDSRFWINTEHDGFETEMASFYEEYLEIEEIPALLEKSRFCLKDDTAKGFSTFINNLGNQSFVTLKGQVTGPVTTGIGTKDQHNRSIFYDDNLRDMLVRLLALKGRWQVEELKKYTAQQPPIIFIDEPGMVSFGSSAFTGISKEMVADAVAHVIAGIQVGGGLAGVHICANGDWGPVLSSTADIISFDGYFYFDNFTLYKDQLINYLERGGLLAWGIIPTGDPEILKREDSESLFTKWQEQLEQLSSFGFSKKMLMDQTFIAPSCGTGSLSLELALRVLVLTGEVSKKAQKLLQES